MILKRFVGGYQSPETGESGTGSGGDTATTTTPTAPVEPAAPAKPKLVIKRAEAKPAPIVSPTGPAQPTATPAPTSSINAELAALQAEREALRKETETIKAWRLKEEAGARRQYIRDQGLAVDFADEDLDRLLPQADPRTDAGKTALNAWREKQGARYFRTPAPAPALSEKEIITQIVGDEKRLGNRLFGARHVQIMRGGN